MLAIQFSWCHPGFTFIRKVKIMKTLFFLNNFPFNVVYVVHRMKIHNMGFP